jgi:hypothetical protein
MTKKHQVTIKHTVVVTRTPEQVWDFTQDWTQRSRWDPAITSAEIIESEAAPLVRAKGSGWTSFVAKYKLYDRPRRTSLVMVDCVPSWLGGGGAWSYEPGDDRNTTCWTQTNTLTLGTSWIFAFLKPLFRWQLGWFTRRAMRKAKRMMEREKHLPRVV